MALIHTLKTGPNKIKEKKNALNAKRIHFKIYIDLFSAFLFSLIIVLYTYI